MLSLSIGGHAWNNGSAGAADCTRDTIAALNNNNNNNNIILTIIRD
jgi:hypothetical protein